MVASPSCTLKDYSKKQAPLDKTLVCEVYWGWSAVSLHNSTIGDNSNDSSVVNWPKVDYIAHILLHSLWLKSFFKKERPCLNLVDQ